jgi:SAM-dependent methyltransferase
MRARERDGLNRLCDISDWRPGRFQDILFELGERPMVHRKAWEYGMCILGLEKLGCIRPEAEALAVGAGTERPLFYFANRIKRMVATDIYDGVGEGRTEMLTEPARFAPFEYREDHLEVRRMSGCDLELEDDSFDFAFTLSSIEHFGTRTDIARSVRELERVLKPGGVVCIATEYILNKARHEEFFTHEELQEVIVNSSGLTLVEPDLDLSISESLLRYPIDLVREENHHVSPHIVLENSGVIWTSIILFFRKS